MMGTYFTGYKGNFNPLSFVVIGPGQPYSSVVICGGFTLCGVLLPAAFTGTQISFFTSQFDGGSLQQIVNAAGPVVYTVAGGEYVAIDPKDFYGVNFLVIKSNANEAAERDFYVALRGF